MPDRFMITHSLLSAWLYAMKDNPYADAETEYDPFSELLTVLRREPTPQTEAMQNGIDFEDLVTAITAGGGDTDSKWFDAAQSVARIVSGAQLQYKAYTDLTVDGVPILLYGRLDALKEGHIYDIKFSKSYERGKYLTSTQHGTYFNLIPEADEFTYIISDGTNVWTETYRRDETQDITVTIHGFIEWLRTVGLMSEWKEHWKAL